MLCAGLQHFSGKLVLLELIRPLKQSLIMCAQVTSGTPTDPASLPQRPGETVCAVSGLNCRHHFQLHLFSFCNQA